MTTKIFAGQLFDPLTESLKANQLITVSRPLGIILDVQPFEENDWNNQPDDVEVVDLRKLTVSPGFVDTHVHMFLHSYEEASWTDQLTKESLAERTIRATVHAKKTLLAGFTTVRDLGTEGAEDADIALRKCVSGPNPIIPGPRLFIASRAIISSGSYGPLSVVHPLSQGVEGISGAVVADGVDECIKAVRQQAGTGADWIKIYVDYRSRTRMAPTSTLIPAKSFPNFTPEERQAMLEEAHRRGLKVAIHCTNAWDNFLCNPGYFRVDSLEHGMNLLLGAKDEHEEWSRMRRLELSHVPWTPTLSIVWKQHLQNPQENGPWDHASRAFKKALEMGLDNITTGGDTGPSPHGENALELILMRRLGAPWSKVLRWATFGGWQCLKRMGWDEDNLVGKGIKEVGENDMAFGVIQPGWAADIIGFQGTVDGEVEEFEKAVKNVEFVMKNGRIWKENGLFVESV